MLTWNTKLQDWDEIGDFSTPDIVKAVTFCGPNAVCVGYKKEYNIMNMKGAVTELIPVGNSGNPVITLLPNNQLLLGRDRNGRS